MFQRGNASASNFFHPALIAVSNHAVLCRPLFLVPQNATRAMGANVVPASHHCVPSQQARRVDVSYVHDTTALFCGRAPRALSGSGFFRQLRQRKNRRNDLRSASFAPLFPPTNLRRLLGTTALLGLRPHRPRTAGPSSPDVALPLGLRLQHVIIAPSDPCRLPSRPPGTTTVTWAGNRRKQRFLP